MRALRQLAWIIALTGGKSAAWRALPLYSVLLIGTVVLFGGNGLDAETVVRPALASPGFRMGLLLFWALITLPAVNALLTSPESFFLRWLPVPASRLYCVFTVYLLLAELPWVAVWAAGAPPLAALAAVLCAMALHVALVARVRGWADGLRLMGVVLAWGFAPMALGAAVGAVAFWTGLAVAWRRAPEQSVAYRHFLPGRVPWSALAAALGVSLVRSHRAAIVRSAVLGIIALAGGTLFVLNNVVRDPAQVLRAFLFAWVPACVFGAATVAGPLLRTEASADWVLDLYRVSLRGRAGAVAAVMTVVFGALGALFGAGAAWLTNLSFANQVGGTLALMVAGAVLSWVTSLCVRLGSGGTGAGSARTVQALVVILLVCLVSVVLLPPLVALLLWLVLAGALAVVTTGGAHSETNTGAPRGDRRPC